MATLMSRRAAMSSHLPDGLDSAMLRLYQRIHTMGQSTCTFHTPRDDDRGEKFTPHSGSIVVPNVHVPEHELSGSGKS